MENLNSVHDLGSITEPLLIFSGPCSNLQATQALLDVARDEGFAPDRVICTGDIVAYCADPGATTQAIQDFGCHVLMGNCEESFGSLADDCGCGFEEGSSCDVLSVAWFRHGRERLTPEMTQWMATRPQRFVFTMNGRKAVVVHGSVDRINEFVFPSTSADLKAQQIANVAADLVIGGHSGVPFSQRVNDALWHNSGIIGIPANDGTPRVWFSTLTPVEDGIRVEHRALDYAYAEAAKNIREADTLPNDYANCLETGVWPSDDVMPALDRDRRGIALTETATVWSTR